MIINKTVIKTKEFSVKELFKPENIKVLSRVIQKYRWELFDTYAGYKVIVTGWSELIYIEIAMNDKRINRQAIQYRLEVLERCDKLSLDY